MQPPGGIDHNQAGAAARRRGHGVEDHRTGVAALLAAHAVDAETIGPRLQLLRCRRTKRVGGRQQHAMTRLELTVRELGDARGLSRSVDTDHQPHRDPVVRELKRPVDVALALQLGDELLGQQRR